MKTLQIACLVGCVGITSAAAQQTTVTGTLNAIWADPPPGGGAPSVIYSVVSDSGWSTTVHLTPAQIATAGGLQRLSGARVTISGDGVQPAAVARAAEISASAVSLVGAGPLQLASAVTGSKPMLTLLCRFQDTPIPLPASSYTQPLSGTTVGSADYYYREVSNGQVNLAGSRVLGWYNLPFPKKYYVPDDRNTQFSRLTQDCITAADADVDFTQFAGIVIETSSSFYEGFAYGSPVNQLTLEGKPLRYGLVWLGVPGDGTLIMNGAAIAHEIGHSFGLPHSGPAGNTQWDVMSYVGSPPGPGTIAWHKDLLGWLPASRVYAPAVTPSQATITLERSELPSASGYLMARLPIPGAPGQFYTVEARRRVGLDALLPGEGVLIFKVNPADADFLAKLVDGDGNGNYIDSGVLWTPGETFTDATAGISVKVEQSSVATAYQVTITTGTLPPTRTLTTTVTGPGELASSYIPGSVHCATTCTSQYANGAVVDLIAEPAAGYAAVWGGACASHGSGIHCSGLTMSQDLAVSVSFVAGHRLDLRVFGGGGVFGFEPGVSDWAVGCNNSISFSHCDPYAVYVAPNTTIDLFLVPEAGWTGGAWGGDCAGSSAAGTCRLTTNRDYAITATFVGGSAVTLSRTSTQDSILVGTGIQFVRDSVMVVNTGPAVSWTATTSSPWLTLGTVGGTGSGFLKWSRSTTLLSAGTYAGQIVLNAGSTWGTPAAVSDTFRIQPPAALSTGPTGHTGSAILGINTATADSTAVSITGRNAVNTSWTATHGAGNWLTLTTASGVGSGLLRWTRNGIGQSAGIHVDTINVAALGVTGSPARIIDSLVVVPALTAGLSASSRRDSIPQGSTASAVASAALTLAGGASTSGAWSVTHGASTWLVLSITTGVGNATIQWSIAPKGVKPGLFVDTVSVAVVGLSGGPLRIIDTLRVYEPIVSLVCAQNALLAASACLGEVERNYLDAAGNHDGKYNLGDLLAYLDRKGMALSPALARLIGGSALAGVDTMPSPRPPQRRP